MLESIQMPQKIRTRFAPSPTGELHIGGLRTALYSYALAKHSNGDFLLRIEDTDKKREVKGAKEKIKILLKETFKITWNEDEYFEQSRRAEEGIYKKIAEELVNSGHAFYCNCKPKNAKKDGFSKVLRDPCREKNLTNGAIKLKVPDREKISFTDYVLDKEVTWDSSVVADTILLKTDGFPTYHLAVVVDDAQMKISHVLRGHDWLPSTPIHLLVYKYLNLDLPKIGHLTDILDPNGGKLSKRRGSFACESLISEGYLPEAILNFIMLLGWAPKDNREFFTLREFVAAFEHNGFQKSNPVFNKEKLDWFNKHYIQELEKESKDKFVAYGAALSDYSDEINFGPIARGTANAASSRISNIADYNNLLKPYFEKVSLDETLLSDNYKKHLTDAVKVFEGLSSWEENSIDHALQDIVKKKDYNTGEFFMNLRVALTGQKVTLPSGVLVANFKKEEAIKRLKAVF